GATRKNGVARLWVDDGGPGIPRADRERVWERFWRLERDRESAVAGSGIGLAVVRELATLHHGRAWIDDEGPAAGTGTRVVIELLARIEGLLRRVAEPRKNGGPPPPPFEKFGDIEVLTPSRTVLRDGSPVALTPKEYDLLLALIRRDGACITRSELLIEVWGYSA